MPADDLAELERQIKSVRESLAPASVAVQKAEDLSARRKDRDRSWIAVFVIGTYAVAIVTFLVYVWVNTPGPSAPGSWQEAAPLMKELIGSAVLPIVTLVLGYYFGIEKGRAG